MCSPKCISSQVPAPVPVTHFLMCWGPGMVLSPPRISCDSVGSTFSRALSCPSLPGSCFPLSESGVCYQSFFMVCKVSLDKSADLLMGVLLGDNFFLLLRLLEFSFSLHLDSLLCESWRRLFGLKFWGDLLAS